MSKVTTFHFRSGSCQPVSPTDDALMFSRHLIMQIAYRNCHVTADVNVNVFPDRYTIVCDR